jgi:hypothetical protein
MIDDDFLQIEAEGHQPSNLPSRMGLFVYSSILYDILDKILITFYTPETATESPAPTSADDTVQKLLSNILTYNRQLDGFQKSIPEYLRLPAREDQPHMNASHVQLQARILNCR